jgi:hypothetical protein
MENYIMRIHGCWTFFFVCLIGIIQPCLPVYSNSENDSVQPGDKDSLINGFIYYADLNKTALKSIEKHFSSSLDDHQLGMQIIAALFEGPTSPACQAIWAHDTRLNSFFITDDGRAYADLSPADSFSQPMDTMTEMLAIYSLVNSLTVNIPGIKEVKILIQGQDAATLAGHMDLDLFYTTNMLIVK